MWNSDNEHDWYQAPIHRSPPTVVNHLTPVPQAIAFYHCSPWVHLGVPGPVRRNCEEASRDISAVRLSQCLSVVDSSLGPPSHEPLLSPGLCRGGWRSPNEGQNSLVLKELPVSWDRQTAIKSHTNTYKWANHVKKNGIWFCRTLAESTMGILALPDEQ